MKHHLSPNRRLEKVINFIIHLPPFVQLLIKLTVKLLILLLKIAPVRLFMLTGEGIRKGGSILAIANIRLNRISFKLKRFWLEWMGSVEQIDRLNQELEQQITRQNLNLIRKLMRDIEELEQQETPPVIRQTLWEMWYGSLEELRAEFDECIHLTKVDQAIELANEFSRAYCQSKEQEKPVFRMM